MAYFLLFRVGLFCAFGFVLFQKESQADISKNRPERVARGEASLDEKNVSGFKHLGRSENYESEKMKAHDSQTRDPILSGLLRKC